MDKLETIPFRHIVLDGIAAVIDGVGITLTTKLTSLPIQARIVGLTIYVTVPAVLLEVVIVCAGIVLLFPDGMNPVIPKVAEAVQVNVVIVELAVKFIIEVCEPEQIV